MVGLGSKLSSSKVGAYVAVGNFVEKKSVWYCVCAVEVLIGLFRDSPLSVPNEFVGVLRPDVY